MVILFIFIVFAVAIYYYTQSNYTVSAKNIDTNLKKTKSLTGIPINKKIIVSFKGSTYDVTNFSKRHPGGKTVLVENNGKDIEQIMLDIGHSDNAYEILEKLKIQD